MLTSRFDETFEEWSRSFDDVIEPICYYCKQFVKKDRNEGECVLHPNNPVTVNCCDEVCSSYELCDERIEEELNIRSRFG